MSEDTKVPHKFVEADPAEGLAVEKLRDVVTTIVEIDPHDIVGDDALAALMSLEKAYVDLASKVGVYPLQTDEI